MSAERNADHVSGVLFVLAGLVSGLITAGLTWPAGRLGGFVLGGVFGMILAASLAIGGVLRSVARAVGLTVISAVAYYLAIAAAAAVELNSPWVKWSMSSPSSVSPLSLFAGGAVGGLILLTSSLLLARGNIGTRAFARAALIGSAVGGILAMIGWSLGPTLGMAIWSGVHAIALTAPTETFQNALGETSHRFSLFVIWQTGMSSLLGIMLN